MQYSHVTYSICLYFAVAHIHKQKKTLFHSSAFPIYIFFCDFLFLLVIQMRTSTKYVVAHSHLHFRPLTSEFLLLMYTFRDIQPHMRYISYRLTLIDFYDQHFITYIAYLYSGAKKY